MPKDSKRVRHLRRLKRENTLAYRGLEALVKERDYYRALAVKMIELEKDRLAKANATPALTIKTLVEDDKTEATIGLVMAGDTTPTPVQSVSDEVV